MGEIAHIGDRYTISISKWSEPISEVSSELFEMGIEGASYQTVAEKSTGWNIKITIWNGDRKGKGTSYQTVAENQHWL